MQEWLLHRARFGEYEVGDPTHRHGKHVKHHGYMSEKAQHYEDKHEKKHEKKEKKRFEDYWKF